MQQRLPHTIPLCIPYPTQPPDAPAEDGYVEEGQLPLRHLPPPVVRHGLQQAGQQVRGALPHGVEDGQRAHQQGIATLGCALIWGGCHSSEAYRMLLKGVISGSMGVFMHGVYRALDSIWRWTTRSSAGRCSRMVRALESMWPYETRKRVRTCKGLSCLKRMVRLYGIARRAVE